MELTQFTEIVKIYKLQVHLQVYISVPENERFPLSKKCAIYHNSVISLRRGPAQ